MSISLSKSANNVQVALHDKGIECQVVELPNSTRTAIDAATSIGCHVSQIVKSLIFKTKKSGKPVLILASGTNRVDEKIIKSQTNEKVIKANADFAKQTTGYAIGGIPPLGHKQPIELIFIDQDLLNFEYVWAAAGTPNAVFKIRSQDLAPSTGGKLISITEAPLE